jgi:hypothetical protein
MPRWLRNTICALVMLLVFAVCVHPAVDLSPTTFRYAAFAAAVLLLLRSAFRFMNAGTVLDSPEFFRTALAPAWSPSSGSSETSPLSLRC